MVSEKNNCPHADTEICRGAWPSHWSPPQYDRETCGEDATGDDHLQKHGVDACRCELENEEVIATEDMASKAFAIAIGDRVITPDGVGVVTDRLPYSGRIEVTLDSCGTVRLLPDKIELLEESANRSSYAFSGSLCTSLCYSESLPANISDASSEKSSRPVSPVRQRITTNGFFQDDSCELDCLPVWNLDAKLQSSGILVSEESSTDQKEPLLGCATPNSPEEVGIIRAKEALREAPCEKKMRARSRVRFADQAEDEEDSDDDDRTQKMITVHFRDKLKSTSTLSTSEIASISCENTRQSIRSRFKSDLVAVMSESEGDIAEEPGRIVPVDYDLPPSAFEICHDYPQTFRGRSLRQTKFAFTRSARNSLLINWGLPPLPQQNAQQQSGREQRNRFSSAATAASGTRYRARTSLASAWSSGSIWSSFWTNSSSNTSFVWGYLDVIDPYTKATDAFCIRNFLAIAMGAGTLNLPAAIALCGYVPGFLILYFMTVLQASLAHRLIDAPMLLNTDLENYVDIATACFKFPRYPRISSSIVGVTKVMTLLSFFGFCTINLLTIMWSLQAIFGLTENSYWLLWSSCICGCFLLMNVGFSTHVRDLRRTSRACLFIMHSLLVFVSICSIWNRVDPEAKPIVYKPFGTLSELFDGAALMMYNCSGIVYLPFVFSDLYEPAQSEVVVRTAYRHLSVFWFTMAIVGYLGWGESAGTGIFDITITVLGYFPKSGRILRIMIGLQALLSYPLLFAPLFRMVECLLALELSPAVSLHLPWAIRKLWWQKKGLQVGLIFTGLVSNVATPISFWMEGMAWIPTNFCSMILPAGFSFVFEARRRARVSEASLSEATTPASSDVGSSSKRTLLTKTRDSITLNMDLRISGGGDSNVDSKEETLHERNIFLPLTSLVLGIVILLAGMLRLRSKCDVACLRDLSDASNWTAISE